MPDSTSSLILLEEDISYIGRQVIEIKLKKRRKERRKKNRKKARRIKTKKEKKRKTENN